MWLSKSHSLGAFGYSANNPFPMWQYNLVYTIFRIMAGHLVAMKFVQQDSCLLHDNLIGSYVIITYVVVVLDISP